MIKNRGLKVGDTIGVIAQSEPITKECTEEMDKAVKLMEDLGVKVKFAKHVYENTTGYGEIAKNKAEDINTMFADKEIKAIFCAMGGYNCNSVFDYLDFDLIKNNPKVICGYSDPTSLINIIYAKTGIITFHGPNFKSLASEETDYGYTEMKKRFFEKDISMDAEYKVIKSRSSRGKTYSGEIFLCFQI